MTDDVPPEFAGRPAIDLGEVSVEDIETAIEALTHAIKNRKCETLRDNFNTGNLSDTLKRGLMGVIQHYAEHGENGGKIARLIRESGIINDIPVMIDPSVNWGDVTH
jgi:hypothetical protein